MDPPPPMRTNRHSSRTGRVLAIILGCLILPIGALIIGLHIDDARRARAYAKALTAEATIRSADVITRKGSNGSISYRVDVSFAFPVGGRTYMVSRPFIEPFETSRLTEATAVAAAFPVGAKRTAYYHQDHPEMAILEPRLTRDVVNPIFGGAAMCSFGLTLIVFPFSVRRYHAPDLPVNTIATEHGYAILPSSGWGLGGLTLSALVGLGVIGAGSLSLPRWPAEPSLAMVYAVSIVGMLFPVALRVLLGSIVHQLSGAIVLDQTQGTLALMPLRRGVAPTYIKPFEQIVDAKLRFRPAKNARSPLVKAANFEVGIETLPTAGVDHAKAAALSERRFSSHMFQRDDANELLGWLRCQLALEAPATTNVQ